MRTIQSKKMAVLALGIAMALASCEPKPQDDSYGPSGKKSAVERKIDENIQKLAKETTWDESQSLYGKIKSDISNKDYNLKTKVQKDLNSLADKAYCHSMDTIMYIILSGECKPRHKELDEIHKMREGKAFANLTSTALHEQMEGMYQYHQQMLKKTLPNLKSSKQSPTSLDSEYNDKYEIEAVKKASEYLAENPSCTEIRDGLAKVKEGRLFRGWRKAYCEKLVGLYLQKTEWNQSDENVLRGSLSFYTDVYVGSEEVLEWTNKINDFKLAHQE